MSFSAQAGQTARGVDSSDIGSYGLEGGEGASFGFDFAEDVFADTGAEICGRTGKPASFLLQEVGCHPLGFLRQVMFVTPGFVQGADGLVDFFSAHGTAALESVCCGELAAGGGLGG